MSSLFGLAVCAYCSAPNYVPQRVANGRDDCWRCYCTLPAAEKWIAENGPQFASRASGHSSRRPATGINRQRKGTLNLCERTNIDFILTCPICNSIGNIRSLIYDPSRSVGRCKCRHCDNYVYIRLPDLQVVGKKIVNPDFREQWAAVELERQKKVQSAPSSSPSNQLDTPNSGTADDSGWSSVVPLIAAGTVAAVGFAAFCEYMDRSDQRRREELIQLQREADAKAFHDLMEGVGHAAKIAYEVNEFGHLLKTLSNL